MIFPSDRRILFKKFSPTRIETNSFGIWKKRENKQKLNSFSKDARNIFFPSPYIWRGHPFEKLNCIPRIYRFLILHFDLRLDHQHTFRPFSFQFKTIPNRVSHEPLRNGAEIAFHDSVPAVDFRFSTVKHGYNALCVPCLVLRSIRYRFTAPRFARLSICARQFSGSAKKEGKNCGMAVFTRWRSWLLENRGNSRSRNGRPLHRSFPLSMVLRTPRHIHQLFHGLTPARDGYRREGERENLVANWKRALHREFDIYSRLTNALDELVNFSYPHAIDESSIISF